MYDEIATLYHLIYRDWNAAIAEQAAALDAIIRTYVGPPPRVILDVSCGIGTQALGLAALGHAVTASDVSSSAVERARLEAGRRKLDYSLYGRGHASVRGRSRIRIRRRAQCRYFDSAPAQ